MYTQFGTKPDAVEFFFAKQNFCPVLVGEQCVVSRERCVCS